MESKISIDIDEKGNPYIWIDFKPSDDLRDKVLSRFFIHSGIFIPLEKNERHLKLRIIHQGDESGRIQAMIEAIHILKEEPVV